MFHIIKIKSNFFTHNFILYFHILYHVMVLNMDCMKPENK